MKKVFRTIAFFSFFYTLGVSGAIEQNRMALGAGMICMGIGLGCFWLFCKLSGAIYPSRREKERDADGTGTSINGKRKS